MTARPGADGKVDLSIAEVPLATPWIRVRPNRSEIIR